MKVISTERIPIKSWCVEPEAECVQQAKNLANLPFAFKHIGLMPDCHTGYGMPIGGILACENVVVPNAVGVDIGCGVCFSKTYLKEIDVEILKKILGRIREEIPVGFNHNKESQKEAMPIVLPGLKIVPQQFDRASYQLGTLGGGNHFIEIQKGSDGAIWVMIHSGSRNLGKQVCDYYNRLAKEFNARWFSSIPKDYDLAFFPMDSKEGALYLAEMQYCLEFAHKNRQIMMEKVLGIIGSCTGKDGILLGIYDIRHNYAEIENHFGQNVWVHRKGAIRLRAGDFGAIPGSQGTASYIVRGKENKESFFSCSHGAGRRMSRTKAKETLCWEDEKKRLNDRVILHNMRSKEEFDEAASAYKDIDAVMEEQKDLVEIVTKLEPLAVVKG